MDVVEIRDKNITLKKPTYWRFTEVKVSWTSAPIQISSERKYKPEFSFYIPAKINLEDYIFDVHQQSFLAPQ